MAGVRIDLHVHSNASDGTDAPAEVMRRAAAAGLDVVALTDHDTQAGLAEARAALPDLTWGRLAQVVIITVGHIQGHMIQEALSLTAKGGQVVVTAMGHYADSEVSLNLFELTLLQKRVQGAIFGGVSPRQQIPLLLEAYRSGRLKLDELVTPYRLDDINQGYQDMRDGKNLRGVIRYTDADY